jgi:hypothetical protein
VVLPPANEPDPESEEGPDNTLAIISILTSFAGYVGMVMLPNAPVLKNLVYLPFLLLLAGGITGIVWKVNARRTGKVNGLGNTAFVMGLVGLGILALLVTLVLLFLLAFAGL